MRPLVFLILVSQCVASGIIYSVDLHQNVNIVGDSINSIWQSSNVGIISSVNSVFSVDLDTWNVLSYKPLNNYYEGIGFTYNGVLFTRSKQQDSVLNAFNTTTLESISDQNITLTSYGTITTALIFGQFAYLTTSNQSSSSIIKIDMTKRNISSSTLLNGNATSSATYNAFIFFSISGNLAQYYLSNLSFVGLTPIETSPVLSATQGPNNRYVYFTYADHLTKFDLKTLNNPANLSINCMPDSFIAVNATTGYCIDSTTSQQLWTIYLLNMQLGYGVNVSTLGRSYGPGIVYNGILYYGSTDTTASNIIAIDTTNMSPSVQLGLLPSNNNPMAGTYADGYAYFGSFSSPPTIVKLNTLTNDIESIVINNEFGIAAGIAYSGYIYMGTVNPYSDVWSPSILKIQSSPLQLVDKMEIVGYSDILSASISGNKGYFVIEDVSRYGYLAIVDLDLFLTISTIPMQVHALNFANLYGSFVYSGNAFTTFRYSISSQALALLPLYDTNNCVGNGDFVYCTSHNYIFQIDASTFTIVSNITIKRSTATDVITGNILYVPDSGRLVHLIDVSGRAMSYIGNTTLPSIGISAFSDGDTLYFSATNGSVYKMDVVAINGTTGTTGTTGTITTSTSTSGTTTSGRANSTTADSNQTNDAHSSKVNRIEQSNLQGTNTTPTIIGAVVGAVGFVILLAAILAVLILRKRKRPKDSELPLRPKSTIMQTITNVTRLEKVGAGNFGDVYKGLWQETTEVALKKLKSEEALVEFIREANLLSSLNHPNVVHFYGIWRDNDDQYIVTEFMSEGSLSNYVRIHEDTLKTTDLIEMATQIAVGMQYLTETSKIVHRDLSLRNLLVTKQVGKIVVKVSDFGMSRVAEQSYYKSDDANKPIRWCAPEMLNYGLSDMKTDVYAFGITLWELFSYGKLPYVELDNRTVVKEVLQGTRPDIPKGCTTEVFEIMQQCWKENSKDRPTFSELVDMLKKLRVRKSVSQAFPDVEENHVPLYNT